MTATGTQFAIPYVYKPLFTGEPIVFSDTCETKSSKSMIYLDMNEHLVNDDMMNLESQLKKIESKFSSEDKREKDGLPLSLLPMQRRSMEDDREYIIKELVNYHDYNHVGKVGSFCPIMPGEGGGILVREANDKYHAVTGTKGYRWLESEVVEGSNKIDKIDLSYYNSLVNDAIDDIGDYGDIEWFRSEDKYHIEDNGILPF